MCVLRGCVLRVCGLRGCVSVCIEKVCQRVGVESVCVEGVSEGALLPGDGIVVVCAAPYPLAAGLDRLAGRASAFM